MDRACAVSPLDHRLRSIVVAWIAHRTAPPLLLRESLAGRTSLGVVVFGATGEVLPRAKIGHQSPFYFIGIWFWKQIVGDSEFALRTQQRTGRGCQQRRPDRRRCPMDKEPRGRRGGRDW